MHPFRIALAFLGVVVLVAGCDGGARVDDSSAKVEAGLRHYLSSLDPFSSTFPTGSGPPHVKGNSCKKMTKKTRKAQARSARQQTGAPIVPSWSCVVTFRGVYALPVFVFVKANGEVFDALPVPRGSARHPVLPPATTYEGGPGTPKP